MLTIHQSLETLSSKTFHKVFQNINILDLYMNSNDYSVYYSTHRHNVIEDMIISIHFKSNEYQDQGTIEIINSTTDEEFKTFSKYVYNYLVMYSIIYEINFSVYFDNITHSLIFLGTPRRDFLYLQRVYTKRILNL